MAKRNRITVVGAGNVGATLVQRLAEQQLGDVVVVDIVEGMPQGKALDIAESAPLYGYDVRASGANDYGPVEGSDAVVITAGIARKPGMSRSDLLKVNADIVGGVADQVRRRAPNAVVIVVSNPLDTMTYLAALRTGFPRRRVLGMAGVLDKARFEAFIALELDCSVKDVRAMVLGGHGDTMVPLPRFTTVAGIPIPELLPKEAMDRLAERTRKGGAEIVNLLKTGSAYYAPSAAAAAMVRAVLLDERRMLPCCVKLEGEYGLRDVYTGVPCVLGDGGLVRVVELKLDAAESEALRASAKAVREDMDALDQVLKGAAK